MHWVRDGRKLIEGDIKNRFLGDSFTFPWGRGGGRPPSAKKVDFFRQRKKYSACPENPFLLKTNSVFCIGSNGIFLQMRRKKKIFCPLSGLRGGGPKRIKFKAAPEFGASTKTRIRRIFNLKIPRFLAF